MEKIVSQEDLLGQLAALTIAVRVIFNTHPNPAAAAARFHDEYEQAFARALPRAFPEDFVTGMQKVRAMILKE